MQKFESYIYGSFKIQKSLGLHKNAEAAECDEKRAERDADPYRRFRGGYDRAPLRHLKKTRRDAIREFGVNAQSFENQGERLGHPFEDTRPVCHSDKHHKENDRAADSDHTDHGFEKRIGKRFPHVRFRVAYTRHPRRGGQRFYKKR